jgi:hypothetical protein
MLQLEPQCHVDFVAIVPIGEPERTVVATELFPTVLLIERFKLLTASQHKGEMLQADLTTEINCTAQ